MRFMLALLLSLALAVPAFAAFDGPGAGGFRGPGPKEVTQSAQVRDALDDTPCTLEGRIFERIGGDKYTFEDASGKVIVEIDDKVFHGNTVTPETRVRLVGEVERKKHGRPNEVDVRYLEIVR